MPSLAQVSVQESINQFDRDTFQPIEQLITGALGHTFPSISMTVIKDGDVLLNRAWGYIDPLEQTLPVGTEAVFDLASVTKLFTMTTLLALLSARALEFNTPLVDLIPEFGEGGLRPVDGGQDPHTGVHLPVAEEMKGKQVDPRLVTLWHLLTHTSGLSPWRDVYTVAGPVPVPPDQPEPVSRQVRWGRAVEALCRYPFVGEPGEVVRYSDLGLLLLGEVVRRLSGMELDAAIQAQVLDTLGLESPAFDPVRNGRDRRCIPPTEEDQRWRLRRVWGEVHDENACGVGGVAGHAGLFAAARDVAALGQAWLDEDARLAIAPATMREAKREQATTGEVRRGLGWQMKTLVGANAGDLMSDETFGHTGFVGNSLWIDPTRRLVVTTLTNAVYCGRAFEGMYEFRRAIHDAVVRATGG